MTEEETARAGPTSIGALLGGCVRYHQLEAGYRTGIEPVLLAASVPARPGERVIEGGTGAGAGLLCLAARVPGLNGVGLEIDPMLAGVAHANFEANGFAGLEARHADVCTWHAEGPIDHAFANPPWHDPAGTPSPSAGRRLAKQAGGNLLTGWAVSLGRALRKGGTLSLMVPASSLAEACVALQAAGCPQIGLLPLWPRTGRAAKLIILSGVRGGRGAGRVSAGLVLHEANGGYTQATEQILRHAASLPFSGEPAPTRAAPMV